MKAHRTSIYSNNDRLLLENCTLCPRECGVERFAGGSGYCGISAGFNVASVCVHNGEEPAISGKDGICNIFFRGCNLRCAYCQNHEISRSPRDETGEAELDSVMGQIKKILDSGINTVGFVSPSHVVPQVKVIIEHLHHAGYDPVTVYNTNSYDKVDALKSLDGMIDVYLPDFKYITSCIAAEYSDADDYPVIAIKALKEMYYQKGSILRTDEEGRAENGLIIRHLVLPGRAAESKLALRAIAEEISTGVTISLMSQYHPVPDVINHTSLGRPLYLDEYESVVNEMEELGFRNGWIQDMDSYLNYRPDFSLDHPFEK
ncbi:MAG TPA: radical SAM protein [Bacteroidales bacterium]|nr:radical SAM protein [Bacteroidales bacterium]